MESTMHWLPKRSAPSAISSGPLHRRAVHGDLVGARPQQAPHVIRGIERRRPPSAG